MAGRTHVFFTHRGFKSNPPQTWRLRDWSALFVLLLVAACRQIESLPSAELPPSLMTKDAVPLGLPTSPQTVAVLPIKNLNPQSAAPWLAPTLTEFITSDLSHWPHLDVISRQALGSVLREQWYQNQGFHSEEGVRPGRLQGARFIIQGGCLEQNDQISVNLQVIDVETGVVAGSVRADGTVQEFPILEQTVVKQLVDRISFLLENLSSVSERKRPTYSNPELATPISGERQIENQEGGVATNSVNQEEIWLSLEKLTHQRLAIMKVGQIFFKRGVSIEMGHPRYGVWESEGKFKSNFPIVSVPLSVFVESSRVRDIVNREVSPELASRLSLAESGISLPNNEFLGEQRLLEEQLTLPRRLFVRALGPSGTVKAVFSRLEWRTDRVISIDNGGRIVMPMWPQPLLTGLAEIPASWLEPEDPSLKFDAIFVPISREEVNVAVEWIDSEKGGSESGSAAQINNHIRLGLQRWIRERWAPPITETLPGKDYLPGNKREAYLLLHIENGGITHVQISGDTSDPVFARSLHNLQDDLLHSCPWCNLGEGPPDALSVGAFRVQCTLVKDISSLGLGTQSP